MDKNNSLVACFGGFGRKKGLLHFPYGVCEQDGILYVSDTNNHRIQVTLVTDLQWFLKLLSSYFIYFGYITRVTIVTMVTN